jgi:hypothetical protein
VGLGKESAGAQPPRERQRAGLSVTPTEDERE